jgi:hypothetical protein
MNKHAELLLSAASELKSYIDAENKRLKSAITCTDLDEPAYHDHQTCAELYEMAMEIQEGIDYNNETISANDEHALNRIS